jgi:hypothetical protein
VERKSILPDFQDFLRTRKLVPEKNIPYFANWVSKFLNFSNKSTQSDYKKLILEFMDALAKTENVQDWQIRQAHQAIQLYLCNYRGKAASDSAPLSGSTAAKGEDIPSIIKEMRGIIRLKHYSYNTERTYIDWSMRFFRYVRETKDDEAEFTTDDIRQYLSHLAIKRNVSGSTQNQALLLAISN